MRKKTREPNFDSHTPEEEIMMFIHNARQQKSKENILVELLSERHPLYEGRSNYQLIKIKGYTLASFAITGVSEQALSYILDELENGKKAYLVAAAARGLTGYKTPGTQFVSYLLRAVDNIKYVDDAVSLDEYTSSWTPSTTTTAMKEIFKSFQWLKGYAISSIPELEALLKHEEYFDTETRAEIQNAITAIQSDPRKLTLSCCEIPKGKQQQSSYSRKKVSHINSLAAIGLENQSGQHSFIKDFFGKKPTIVGFFYTRCMNPNKCTLTINKLGILQQQIHIMGLEGKVNIAAITYDPEYDTPNQMRTYGEHRGMVFDDNTQMFRISGEEYTQVSDFFKLGVNYTSTTVNQHRLELHLLDANGYIDSSYVRLQWEIQDVLNDIKRLCSKPPKPLKKKIISSGVSVFKNTLVPILIAFFPKCPFCWSAYLSAFGIVGLKNIPYSPWIVPILIIGVGVNLFFLYRGATVRNGKFPFYVALLGTILLLVPGYIMESKAFLYLGTITIFLGAMLNSLPYSIFRKLIAIRWHISKQFINY